VCDCERAIYLYIYIYIYMIRFVLASVLSRAFVCGTGLCCVELRLATMLLFISFSFPVLIRNLEVHMWDGILLLFRL